MRLTLILAALLLLVSRAALANEKLLAQYLNNAGTWYNDICIYKENAGSDIERLLADKGLQLTPYQTMSLLLAKYNNYNCTGDYFFQTEQLAKLTQQIKRIYTPELGNRLFLSNHKASLINFIREDIAVAEPQNKQLNCRFWREQRLSLDLAYGRYWALFETQFCSGFSTEERLKAFLYLKMDANEEPAFNQVLYYYLMQSYSALGLDRLALEMSLKAANFDFTYSDQYVTLFNSANIYINLGEIKNAELTMAKLGEIADKLGNDEEYQVDLLTISAEKYYTNSNWQAAYQLINEKRHLLPLVRAYYGSFSTDIIYGLACAWLQDNECAKATYALLKAANFEVKAANKVAMEYFLIKYFIDNGELTRAESHIEALARIQQSYMYDEKFTHVASLLSNMQHDLLDKELAITEIKLQWSRISMVVLTSAMLMISVLLYVLLKQHNRQKQLAEIDELTQIRNRRATIQAIKHLPTPHQGLQHTLVLFDIDNFKAINDEFSHLIGDVAIKHIVKVVKSHIRETDIFGRIGGEEFIFCLTNTTKQMAKDKVEKIRQSLEDSLVRVSPKESLAVTASFGVMNVNEAHVDFEAVYMDLDQSLYQAKANGKNCIVFV